MALERDTRICAHCGAAYTRPTGLTRSEWAKRQFCSKRCASRHRMQTHHHYAVRRPPATVKTCPVCGREFTRGRLAHTQWETRTYCSNVCRNRMHGFRAAAEPPGILEPCECGHPSTTAVRVTTLTADGNESTGWLHLCADCKQLFDDEENARQVWGAVQPEPHKRRYYRRGG